jgi:hypothetical protein
MIMIAEIRKRMIAQEFVLGYASDDCSRVCFVWKPSCIFPFRIDVTTGEGTHEEKTEAFPYEDLGEAVQKYKTLIT